MSAEDDDLAGLEDVSSDEEDDGNEADWFDTEKKTHPSRKRSRGEANPLMEGEGKSFKVLGFNQNQRAAFVQILMRYGLGDFDWSEFIPRLKQKSLEEIREYGTLFLSHIAEDITNSPSFSDGVPKEGLRIQDVLVRVAILHLMRDKVKLMVEKPGTPLFAEETLLRFPGLRSGRHWKQQHDLSLLKAVLKHGYGRWQAIIEDKDLGFQDIIRREQNLNTPSLNGSATGAAQIPDGVNHENHARGTVSRNDAGSILEPVAQGSTDMSKGNQLYQDGSMLYHLREVQRRMVEYIKKRVLLLEKAINAGYQKEAYNHMKASQPVCKEPELQPKVPEAPSPNSSEAEFQFYDPLTPLEVMAAEELSAVDCDDRPDRREIVRLYNDMCKLIDDNIQDSVKAYVGSKSAGSRLRKNLRPLEVIHGDIHKILDVQKRTPSAVEELNSNQSAPCNLLNDASGASVPSVRGGGDSKPVAAGGSPQDPKLEPDRQDSTTPDTTSVASDRGTGKEPCLVVGESACLMKGAEDVEMTDPAGGLEDAEMREVAVGDGDTDATHNANGEQPVADVIVLDD